MPLFKAIDQFICFLLSIHIFMSIINRPNKNQAIYICHTVTLSRAGKNRGKYHKKKIISNQKCKITTIPFLNSITCPASLQVRSKSKKVARFESWRAILMKYYACAGTIKQTAWHARYIDSDTARTDRRKRTRLLRTQNTGWFRSLNV